MAPVVTMKQLLEAGVHFGHQTRRWNPKMKRFIFGERNGIYIIDLQQTLARIETAYSFVRDLVADDGTVLFVGTKKQAQDPVQSYAEKCGMPYVNERWLGGMLTNFETISKRVGKMQEYRRMRDSGEFDAMPKKEALIIGRELEKLERNLGGIRTMERPPNAVFVLDTKKEHIAVTEANKLGIPIVAVVDTNCDPDLIQFVIPGNDDAIRSGMLMCRIVADAVDEGRFIASRRRGGPGPAPASRTPEDEARIAAEQAEARRQALAAAQEREARVAAARQRAVLEAEALAQSDTDAPAAADEQTVAPEAPASEQVDTTTDAAAPTEADTDAAAPAEADVAAPAPAEADVAAPAAQATTHTEE
jgi:small subunit ribosomal protein S2